MKVVFESLITFFYYGFIVFIIYVLLWMGWDIWRQERRGNNMTAKKKMDVELEELQKEIEETEKKEDLEAIKKGYKYKVCGWVHPVAGGDDYQIKVYLPVKPKKEHHEFVRETLKNAGSAVLDDYQVIELIPEDKSN